jgi:hypothetical protein
MTRKEWRWMQASVALVAAGARAVTASMRVGAGRRETSWRELVHRLAKNPAKR